MNVLEAEAWGLCRVGEFYCSITFGPELKMIFVSGRAGRALIATPRREDTDIFRLSSTLSLLFLDQSSRRELVWSWV